MRLIYHPQAEAELVAAAHYYECQITGLGGEFLEAVDRAIILIGEAPDRCPVLVEDVRRYLMPRFPYGIYYRLLEDNLRVLAFKHHSRHPGNWRRRLAD